MANTDNPVLKLVLVGEYGVGKSSLFRRFVHDSFVESSDRRSTLGFDHYEKTYNVEGRKIILQLWDTGGLERVASVTSSYFKHADAALLVFSHDAMDSFNALSQHLLEVVASAENARLFLCGNKSDTMAQGMGPTEKDVETFYQENQIAEGENLFKQTYTVSCKTRQGVDEMFADIAAQLARGIRPSRPNFDQMIRLKSVEGVVPKSCCSE
uniref:Uncharacterized protein n=1 Tax=Plectus sambesii TaxID=2011161 RepID=A0A914WBE9_9BILA